MKECIWNWIKENKYTAGLFFLIFVFSFLLRLSTDEATTLSLILKSAFFALLNTSFLYVLFDLFIYLRLRLLIVILFSVFVTLDVSVFYSVRSPLNFGIMASIFETNIDESLSMMKGLYLVVIIVLCLFGFLFLKSSKEVKLLKRIPIVFSLTYLIVALFVFPAVLDMKTDGETPPMVYEAIKSSPHMYLSRIIPRKYPFVIGDIVFVASYLKEISILREQAQKDKILPEGIKYMEFASIPTKVVLVIGEAAHRGHMSAYGYSVKTTPFLDSLQTNSNQLVIFDSVISPTSYTRDAIRITLSYSTARDKNPFWDNKNLVHLANDGGYETMWIANQAQFGLNDSYAGQIAASTKIRKYAEKIYSKKGILDDLSLVPVLRSNLKRGKKQFAIFHLIGSHVAYSDKYDKVDSKALGDKGETIEYDKSIHHTDRVLRGIYNELINQKDDFVLLYYSDHAEVVNKGHAILNRYKDQYKIPLVIISDSLTKEKYVDRINKYYSSETNRLNSSNLIYFLGEIIGYSVSDSLVSKARKETEYTYQVDGSVKRYSEIKD